MSGVGKKQSTDSNKNKHYTPMNNAAKKKYLGFINKHAPFLEPEIETMRKQSLKGWIGILNIIGVIVGVTHGVALTHGRLPRAAWWIGLILIYLEAVVAILFGISIYIWNSSCIERSIETCFPLPNKVKKKLKNKKDKTYKGRVNQGENIQNNGNYSNTPGQSSYCIRCLVWRPMNAHHCSLCQRCYTDFSHHCTCFGRCISGTMFHEDKGCTGNLPYLIGIKWMGYIGFITMIILTFVSLGIRYDL